MSASEFEVGDVVECLVDSAWAIRTTGVDTIVGLKGLVLKTYSFIVLVQFLGGSCPIHVHVNNIRKI